MSEPDYQVADRRPIAARDLPFFQRLAGWFARRGVSANSISIGGMICGILAGSCFFATSYLSGTVQRIAFLAAAALIQLRLLANMLDGMVAIASKKASRLGELFNEMPDRVSDVAILLGAGYASSGNVVFGYAASGMAILTAYVRAAGKCAGARQHYCGPMAKPHRMALMTAAAVYCAIAPAAWRTFGIGVLAIALIIVVIGGAVTCVRRLVLIARDLRTGESAP